LAVILLVTGALLAELWLAYRRDIHRAALGLYWLVLLFFSYMAMMPTHSKHWETLGIWCRLGSC
jgi:hypothetical protein